MNGYSLSREQRHGKGSNQHGAALAYGIDYFVWNKFRQLVTQIVIDLFRSTTYSRLEEQKFLHYMISCTWPEQVNLTKT